MNDIRVGGNTNGNPRVAVSSFKIVMNHLLTTLFIGSLLVPTAIAQTFGVSAGGNFQRLSDISIDELSTQFESQTGWHVGAWLELPLGPAGLRGGARYMAAGMLFEGLQSSFPSARENFDISLVELYLLLRLGIPSQIISPYAFAGPVFRIPSSSDDDINEDLRILSYAGEIGGGIKIGLGPINLYPEIAYVFGLTRFIEDELILQLISREIGDPQRLNMAMLRLSVGF